MHGRSSSRRWVAAVLAVALVASMVGIVPASAAPPSKKAPLKLPTKVTSASSQIIATKLDAKLREAVSAAEGDEAKGAAEVDVAVVVKKGAAKPAGMTKALKLKLHTDAFGDMYVGTAKVSKLVKIASAADVAFMYENGRRMAPIVPDSGGGGPALSAIERKARVARNKARLAAVKAARPAKRPADASGDASGGAAAVGPIEYDGGATGWHDVLPAGHNSTGAWDLGYTGDGVRVAVADDSADFAHPDLQGTQAYVTDTSSPYYGWPMALDPFSALLYAYDAYYGTDYVPGDNTWAARGGTWFTDTSATIDEPGDTWDGKYIYTPGTSKSGTYHIGYLWDENYYAYGFDDFPLVLVADENTAGVYDTVYVDLDLDYDFSKGWDKACTKSDPISYADLWGPGMVGGPDGFADVSGGMIYWIADGTNQPPGVDFMFGGAPSAPGSGEMVCFMGALNKDEDHGTLCSSNVVGQGRSDGPSISGEYPDWRTPDPGTGAGMVQGAAKDGSLVAIADIYWNHFTSTLVAYDYAAFGNDWTEKSGDEIQVISNSYGESDEDADGWDYRSRYITDTNVNWNDEVSYLFSTGNGAPGYGTNAPPSAATAIAVGASTQMGACGGWDSAYDEDQITVGDVIPWSNRGPNASGGLAPDIVADGAYSSGAVPLNMYSYDGSSSWDIWGGTSRSCPVATGNLALVYQAYAATHGGQWPTYAQAKQFLHNGARDLNYDTLVQGAGSIDAGRSAALAAESGGLSVTPSVWQPGDYDGSTYPSFTQMVHPGDSIESTLFIQNTGTDPVDVTITDAWYQESDSTSFEVTLDAAEEDPYDFNRPDYLTDITSVIPAGTDLMVVRTWEDFSDFAPTGAFNTGAAHNVARPVVYDWKDQDESGDLWSDDDTNGFVNAGEIDDGEYMRFNYHNNFANTHEVRVQTPLDRMHDGVFLGFQHNRRDASDGTTVIHVQITFWDRVDMPWLSCPDWSYTGLGAGTIWQPHPQLNVPADAPVGIYEGQYRISDGTNTTIVPVVINVAADDYSFQFGDHGDSVEQLMMNDRVLGAQDWNWRAESGDWRFFWSDGTNADALPAGASWLVHTTWQDRGGAPGQDSDLDTLLYGPYLDAFSHHDPSTFGPYGLAKTGGSANTNLGAGIWTFQTNSGTTDEWVTGPLEAGVNQIMIHNVLYDGLDLSQPFVGETGVIAVDPAELNILDNEDTGTESIDFTTYDLDLTGAAAQAYGLTKRIEATHDIAQDEDWTDVITLDTAAYLDVRTSCPGQDIDLYVARWDGSDWVLVGASETSSGEEHVRIDMPVDGDYLIDVYGYSVSGTQPFDLTISSPMGDDMVLSGIPAGAIPAGGGFTLDVGWTKARPLEDRDGDFEGVIFMGPTEAPSAVQVPVTLHYPFAVESATPAKGDTVSDPKTVVRITLSKRATEDSVTDASVHLEKNGVPVGATVEYDYDTATIVITPDGGLTNGATYGVFLNSIEANDGDLLSTSWTFNVSGVPLKIVPVAGTDRVGTAIEASKLAFADGTAPYVVIATSLNWPDALGGSALAGAVDGPILLTPPTALPATVAAEITRLGAGKAIILGGGSAVGTAVENALKAKLGAANVERLAGANRYETARLTAAKTVAFLGAGYDGTAFLATGANFPDALGASPLAAAKGWPIYLVNPAKGAEDALINAMAADGVHNVHVLGGDAVVSGRAASDVSIKLGLKIFPTPVTLDRLAGANRYATAIAVATYGVNNAGLTWNKLALATGANFPDALAGGPLQGKMGSVMLLTPSASLDDSVAGVLAANKVTIREIHFLGGLGAITQPVRNKVVGILQ